jgi:hypothetical protein
MNLMTSHRFQSIGTPKREPAELQYKKNRRTVHNMHPHFYVITMANWRAEITSDPRDVSGHLHVFHQRKQPAGMYESPSVLTQNA